MYIDISFDKMPMHFSLSTSLVGKKKYVCGQEK